ncbi:MAG TPA: antibiotic biosynthesis monooxygenase [Deltaproteobacteria bacterium]|nr:antibiotic biosynthesis monooxygenase [Deltaproteobacteria bacterium]
MIRVIVTVTLKKGKRKDYLNEMYKILPIVHIETGCIEYGPHVDIVSGIPEQKIHGPDTVMIIERWQNMKALKKHSAAPHMNNFRKVTKELVQSVQFNVLTPAIAEK